MMQRHSTPMSLSEDYGSPANVIRMRPGQDYGEPPPPMAPYLPEAQELNDDHTKVSAGEVARTVWPVGTKDSREQQRKYNDWQRQQAAQQEAQLGTQTIAEQAYQLVGAKDPAGRQIVGQGADTYIYWQNPDNSIVVLQNTSTGAALDTYYSAGSQAANNVLAAYGPHPASTQPAEKTTGEKLQQAAAIAGQVFQASGLSTPPAKEEKEDNTLLYVGLGIGGVVALGLLIAAVRK